MTTDSICPKCGNALPTNEPDQACPKCLLMLALTQTDALQQTLTDAHATLTTCPEDLLPPTKLEPGQTFGSYRIYGLLGRGGMGEVYEAEDLDSGRRLALKVLGHRINTNEARERFVREGRMAASVNHPNSVYVFGSEEIQHRPVITMELVPGGTLKDLVKKDGPLTPAKAVDAILQVIEGLEAAYEKEVLHRDVKPSNCFIDPQGEVKVGDYGLSISTVSKLDSQLTQSGIFMGTPAFASPEQLRGDDLDARSDIYAVGVTLHFLLTGHAPFEETNFVRLMARVLEDAPPNLASVDSKIPRGLARVVSKCLAKSPEQRFRTYAEFRDALAPFASGSPTAPHPLRRFAACATDLMGVGVLNMVTLMVISGSAYGLEASPFLPMITGALLPFAYFAISEGFFGTTISKRQFGLRVIQQDTTNKPSNMRQALLRATFCFIVPAIPSYVVFALNPSLFRDPQGSTLGFTVSILHLVIQLFLFSTMRRRNGMATVYDLISKTRVVGVQPTPEKRPTARLAADELPNIVDGKKVGPFHIMGDVGAHTEQDNVRTMVAYDIQLYRKVWVRQYASMCPPIDPNLRKISRFGRLRWLCGRRVSDTNGVWDAYEAPTGQPFLHAIRTPMEWHQIRHLIADVTHELSAAEIEGSMPKTLGLDQLWITADGRAKILDFAAPGLAEAHTTSQTWKPSPGNGIETAQRLVTEMTTAALHGQAVTDTSTMPLKPIPAHARQFLLDLPQFPDLTKLASAAKALLTKRATVSRRNKFGVIRCFLIVTMAPILFLVMMAATTIGLMSQYPEALPLSQTLGNIEHTDFMIEAFKNMEPQFDQKDLKDRRNAYEVHAAFLAREMIARDPNAFENPLVDIFISQHKGALERIIEAHKDLTTAQVDEARRVVEAQEKTLPVASSRIVDLFPTIDPNETAILFLQLILLVLLGSTVGFVLIPCLMLNLMFNHSPAISLCGMAVVDKTGINANRLRRGARTLIAWSPAILATSILGAMLESRTQLLALWIIVAVLLSIFGGVAMVSVISRKRGLADRLAGTWLVPK